MRIYSFCSSQRQSPFSSINIIKVLLSLDYTSNFQEHFCWSMVEENKRGNVKFYSEIIVLTFVCLGCL